MLSRAPLHVCGGAKTTTCEGPNNYLNILNMLTAHGVCIYDQVVGGMLLGVAGWRHVLVGVSGLLLYYITYHMLLRVTSLLILFIIILLAPVRY